MFKEFKFTYVECCVGVDNKGRESLAGRKTIGMM
jgi:hypothetical protein